MNFTETALVDPTPLNQKYVEYGICHSEVLGYYTFCKLLTTSIHLVTY